MHLLNYITFHWVSSHELTLTNTIPLLTFYFCLLIEGQLATLTVLFYIYWEFIALCRIMSVLWLPSVLVGCMLFITRLYIKQQIFGDNDWLALTFSVDEISVCGLLSALSWTVWLCARASTDRCTSADNLTLLTACWLTWVTSKRSVIDGTFLSMIQTWRHLPICCIRFWSRLSGWRHVVIVVVDRYATIRHHLQLCILLLGDTDTCQFCRINNTRISLNYFHWSYIRTSAIGCLLWSVMFKIFSEL